ncbi:MAG: 4Fe-4S binding protein [Candidatus Diapherotrites archaeon]|nr:4Fe-4S binding protein [Candidatus Diapherotrites archaeon]
MTVKIDRQKCCYCGGCTSICPVAALELKETVLVCHENCVNCGACTKACPVGALEVKK